jgi:hypothetical protein
MDFTGSHNTITQVSRPAFSLDRKKVIAEAMLAAILYATADRLKTSTTGELTSTWGGRLPTKRWGHLARQHNRPDIRLSTEDSKTEPRTQRTHQRPTDTAADCDRLALGLLSYRTPTRGHLETATRIATGLAEGGTSCADAVRALTLLPYQHGQNNTTQDGNAYNPPTATAGTLTVARCATYHLLRDINQR